MKIAVLCNSQNNVRVWSVPHDTLPCVLIWSFTCHVEHWLNQYTGVRIMEIALYLKPHYSTQRKPTLYFKSTQEIIGLKFVYSERVGWLHPQTSTFVDDKYTTPHCSISWLWQEVSKCYHRLLWHFKIYKICFSSTCKWWQDLLGSPPITDWYLKTSKVPLHTQSITQLTFHSPHCTYRSHWGESEGHSSSENWACPTKWTLTL